MSMKLVGSMVVIAGLAAAVQGDVIRDLGGGWEAIITDDQADVLDVVSDGVAPTALVIEKFAEFATFGQNGLPAPLTVTFRQVAPDAATRSRIVITDEVLINNLGQAWVGFTMSLAGPASWNQPSTLAASRAPFTTLTFSNGGQTANFSDGSIAAGATWFPGLASGGLVIDIDIDLSSNAPVTFSLTEVPVIPTPGAAALAALGGVLVTRRRRA